MCPGTYAAAPINAPCRAQPIKVTPFGDRRALQGDGLDVVQGPACAADISDDGKVNVEDLLALCTALGRRKAVFIGHDWGCQPVWVRKSRWYCYCLHIHGGFQ